MKGGLPLGMTIFADSDYFFRWLYNHVNDTDHEI